PPRPPAPPPRVDELAIADRVDGESALHVELHEDRLTVLREDDALCRFAARHLVDLGGGSVLDCEQRQLTDFVATGIVGCQVGSSHRRYDDPFAVGGDRHTFGRVRYRDLLHGTEWARGHVYKRDYVGVTGRASNQTDH